MELKEFYILKQACLCQLSQHTFQKIFCWLLILRIWENATSYTPQIFPTTLQLSTVEYSFSNHFTLLSLAYIQRRARCVYRLKITFKILPIQHVSHNWSCIFPTNFWKLLYLMYGNNLWIAWCRKLKLLCKKQVNKTFRR